MYPTSSANDSDQEEDPIFRLPPISDLLATAVEGESARLGHKDRWLGRKFELIIWCESRLSSQLRGMSFDDYEVVKRMLPSQRIMLYKGIANNGKLLDMLRSGNHVIKFPWDGYGHLNWSSPLKLPEHQQVDHTPSDLVLLVFTKLKQFISKHADDFREPGVKLGHFGGGGVGVPPETLRLMHIVMCEGNTWIGNLAISPRPMFPIVPASDPPSASPST